jgi:membrane protease YdiL (CAAX protease family)
MLIAQFSEWLGAIAVAWLFSLSPRLQKPVTGFKYARRDGITALMLFGLILILAFIVYTVNPGSGVPFYLPPAVSAQPGAANMPRPAPAPFENLGQVLLVAVLSLASFGIALVVRKQPLRSAGWARDLFMPALQMGFAIAILTIFLRNRVMDVLAGLKPAELNILLIAVGISLAEETIFRGYIQLRLSWWLGKWTGLILTALMFTLWHIPAWLNQVPLETGFLLAGLTLAQGLVLGWIMTNSKHVIAPVLYRSVSIWLNFLG